MMGNGSCRGSGSSVPWRRPRSERIDPSSAENNRWLSGPKAMAWMCSAWPQGPGHEVGGASGSGSRRPAGRGETAAIGAECDGPDGVDLLMIVQGHRPPIAAGIPEPNGPVLAARSQLPAIRAERDARYFVPMSAQDQVFLPRGEVPDAPPTDPHSPRPIPIIGAEDDGVHGTRMQEREEWVLRRRAGSSPRRRIPNMDAPIDAGRREAVAVGAERQARDLGQVGLGGRDRFQIGGAPDPDDPGEVGGGKVPAIRAPRDGLDDGLMTRQLHGMCWPRYVPDQHLAAQGDTSRVVSTTGSGDAPAVRAEGDGPDGVGVPLELAAFLACRRVPDDEVARPIGQGARGDQPAAVRAERDALDAGRVGVPGTQHLARGGDPRSGSRPRWPRRRDPPTETSRRPSGLNATPQTGSSWPERVRSSWWQSRSR